jgi:hypothetical protein
LLGDRRVEVVGVINKDPVDRHGGRLERVRDWSSYDLVVTDDEDPAWVAGKAASAGISCVIWVEVDVSHMVHGADAIVLYGANLASGVAPCLASHEVARAGAVSRVTIAWTEPGSPLRSGEAIAFPDPIGGRWGRRHGPNALVAPVSGEWAGAMAKVTSSESGDPVTRIVGVADLATHLEALALAAGALAVGAGAYPAGFRLPADAAEVYLAEALGAGLDVAAYSMTGT